jgi:hypothetical protein
VEQSGTAAEHERDDVELDGVEQARLEERGSGGRAAGEQDVLAAGRRSSVAPGPSATNVNVVPPSIASDSRGDG